MGQTWSTPAEEAMTSAVTNLSTRILGREGHRLEG